MIFFVILLYIFVVITVCFAALVWLAPILIGLGLVVLIDAIFVIGRGRLASIWWHLLTVGVTAWMTAWFWKDISNESVDSGAWPFVILGLYSLVSFAAAVLRVRVENAQDSRAESAAQDLLDHFWETTPLFSDEEGADADDVRCAVLEGNCLTQIAFDEIFRIDVRTGCRLQTVECPNMGGLQEICPIEGGYIIRGETELFRYDQQLNRVWEFSGRDIFATPDGKKSFWVGKSTIHCSDWQGWRYVLDFDGKLICETQAVYDEIYMCNQ